MHITKRIFLAIAFLAAVASAAPAETTVFNIAKVAPRVFAPEENSTEINRVRFYFDNPESVDVAIRIFDVSGALVRRTIDRESETIMYWDGRDQNGDVVKGGIYIYQVETDSKIVSGTVVVSR